MSSCLVPVGEGGAVAFGQKEGKSVQAAFQTGIKGPFWVSGSLADEATVMKASFFASEERENPASFSTLIGAQLAEQLAEVGWENVAKVDPSFREIVWKVRDQEGRSHRAVVIVPQEFPHKAALVEAEIPTEDHVLQAKSLIKCFHAWELAIDKYQEFFDAMDSIDDECAVILPKCPTFADTTRRVALNSNSFLDFEVDALLPRGPPLKWKITGGGAAVKRMRAELTAVLPGGWNKEESLHGNLQRILGEDYCPIDRSATSTQSAAAGVECAMCFQHLTDELESPDVSCENEKCDHLYHKSCVIEWLRRDASSVLHSTE